MTITANLPDGRKLTFPDGTDPAVIQATVKRTLGVQDPRAAQFKAEADQRRQQESQQLQQGLSQDVGPFESAAIGIGRGLTDIGRSVGLADQETPRQQQALQQLEEERPITQIGGRAVGQALPFVPAGLGIGNLASTVARIGAATGLGGLEGAAIESGTGGQNIERSAGIGATIAGGLEALFPVIGRLGSNLIRRFKASGPAGAVIDSAGNPSGELVQALDDAGLSFDDLTQKAQESLSRQPANVDPEQAARVAAFQQLEIPPTRAQVTRRADDFQAQQEAAKTSGRVRDALEGQEGLLVNRFDDAVSGTGGLPVSSGSPVIDTVVNRATILDNEISDLYRAARDIAPDAQNIRLTNLMNLVAKNRGKNRLTNGLISAVSSELKNRGITREAVSSLGSDAIVRREIRAANPISVGQAEQLRQTINTFFDSTTGQGRQMIREFKDALDDDVFSTAGEDIFNQARTAKADFEKQLNRAKVSKFDSRKANLVRDVLENRVNPDNFINDVVTSKKWRADDIQQLKDFTIGGGEGSQAWNDLRAETLDFIKQNAFKGPVDSQGNQAITRAALESTLAKIGKPKLSVIFEPDELAFLRDLSSVTRLREPVRGTALGRGPSAQAVGRVEQAVREQPLASLLIDTITFDRKGRAVVNANPNRLSRQRTDLEKIIPGTLGQVGIVGVAQTEGEQ